MRRNANSVMKISSDSFRHCKYKLWINSKGLQDMLQTHEPPLFLLHPLLIHEVKGWLYGR